MTLSGPDHHTALGRRRASLRVLALCFALSACGRSDAPALLDLSRVEFLGDAIDGEFALYGEGFPPGRTGNIELRGVVHRPGRASVPLSTSLDADVVSETEMRFGLAANERVRALAPGRFEGSVTASFGEPHTRVQGTLQGVSLRVRADSAEARREALVAARRAVSWLAVLGASELEVDAEAGGVRIGQVALGTPAERLGLRAGDRIVRRQGLAVAEVMDLLPDAGRGAVQVRLERADGGAPLQVSLPRSAAQAGARVRRSLVACVLLSGLALLLAWPLPAARRAGVGGPHETGDPEPRPRVSAVAGAVAVALVGMGAQWGAELHVVRGLSVALAVLLAGLLAPGAAWQRPGPWLRVASRASLAALGLAAAGLVTGSMTPALGGSGSYALAQWPLWGEPAAWASVWLTFEALRPKVASAGEGALWCAARGVALASLVAMLSAGGSLGPYIEAPATLGWLLKSAGLWAALELVLPRRCSGLGLAALAVAAPALALAWSLWNPAPDVSATLAAISPWLFGGWVVRAGVARMRAWLWPTRAIDPHLVPFL